MRTVIFGRNLANHQNRAKNRAETDNSDLVRRCIKSLDFVHGRWSHFVVLFFSFESEFFYQDDQRTKMYSKMAESHDVVLDSMSIWSSSAARNMNQICICTSWGVQMM